MSYLYLNKYLRFHRASKATDSLDPYVCVPPCTLKPPSSQSPRRLSSIILPAHALLHPATPNNPQSTPPLKIPSQEYDILRATLVQSELLLLRVLGFELRIPSPLDYIARYLERATEDVERVGDDYDGWGREEKEEYGVWRGGVMEGRTGRGCREMAIRA
ncbi:MAG: hypothetical protein L6R37_004380 [Teloschistes peruensis]|nr:MAG: hypothetical protein L6R37_004380 [Teloschistes peruensis]